MNWQPIETAPTEEEIIVWGEDHGFYIAYLNDGQPETGAYHLFDCQKRIATHWQPLPKPPQ